jgi:hypothetical protein
LQRVHLAKAADHLKAGGAPGFVVLAREQSGLAGNYAGCLTEAIRAEPKKFGSVVGLVIYGTEVSSRHMLCGRAGIWLRSEARSLIPELSVLQRGGRLGLSLF